MDRQIQLECFRNSLEGTSSRRIILVTAGPGMGKSWLVRRFAQEGEARGCARAQIDFSDGQAYDVLTLVRRFREMLGPGHFNPLTTALNEATTPRLLGTDQGGGPSRPSAPTERFATAPDGNPAFGEGAGRTAVRDNHFLLQSDNPLLLQAIEARITQTFFTCLTTLVATTTALFLFDSYERASQEDGERWVANAADHWIQHELLARIHDGRLPNTVVVLAGRRLPPLAEPAWAKLVGRLTLDLLTIEEVGLYLRQGRGLASLTDGEVQTLFAAAQGNPQLLAIIGDSLQRAAGPGAAHDDW